MNGPRGEKVRQKDRQRDLTHSGNWRQWLTDSSMVVARGWEGVASTDSLLSFALWSSWFLVWHFLIDFLLKCGRRVYFVILDLKPSVPAALNRTSFQQRFGEGTTSLLPVGCRGPGPQPGPCRALWRELLINTGWRWGCSTEGLHRQLPECRNAGSCSPHAGGGLTAAGCVEVPDLLDSTPAGRGRDSPYCSWGVGWSSADSVEGPLSAPAEMKDPVPHWEIQLRLVCRLFVCSSPASHPFDIS